VVQLFEVVFRVFLADAFHHIALTDRSMPTIGTLLRDANRSSISTPNGDDHAKDMRLARRIRYAYRRSCFFTSA
jgi:hypothetical protein